MEPGLFAPSWQLADPLWLLALLLLPLVHWLRGRRPQRALVVPFAARWAGRERIERAVWAEVVVWLGLVAVIVAVARPQVVEQRRQVEKKGYDIVLAIDLSPSMLAEDYEENGQRCWQRIHKSRRFARRRAEWVLPADSDEFEDISS